MVHCTLPLLIFFNRHQISDIQCLKVKDYVTERKTDFQYFKNTLTGNIKVFKQHYKRVVNGGKGLRAVVILVPELLQQFIRVLFENRDKYISSKNDYLFENKVAKPCSYFYQQTAETYTDGHASA